MGATRGPRVEANSGASEIKTAVSVRLVLTGGTMAEVSGSGSVLRPFLKHEKEDMARIVNVASQRKEEQGH